MKLSKWSAFCLGMMLSLFLFAAGYTFAQQHIVSWEEIDGRHCAAISRISICYQTDTYGFFPTEEHKNA